MNKLALIAIVALASASANAGLVKSLVHGAAIGAGAAVASHGVRAALRR